MRIALGLTPVYVAALILLFETVREPSLFFQVFSTPSVAEEITSESDAGELNAAAARASIARDASAAGTAGASPPPPQAKTPASLAAGPETPALASGKSATDVVDVEIEKSATDLAKHAAPEVAAAAPETSQTEATVLSAAMESPVPASASEPAAAEVPIDPAAAAAAEEALRLSRGDRREVQRRLRFAEFDPQLIDGIFGPATRAAIAAWQEEAGLPATGYVDEFAMALLVEETADEYRAWRSAERARARREEEAQSTVVVSSAQPWPSEARQGGCRRLPSGEIAFGKDVGCNFRAFSENFKRDFKDLKGSLRDLWR